MRIQVQRGFTLIELAIVLVVIGLVIGSVMLGRDMIRSSELRAQAAQLERFNTAAQTFRTKYNCLPGDCATAEDYGLPARGPYPGQGDGDGILYSNVNNTAAGRVAYCMYNGEQGLFWVDLSQAGLIEGTFSTASATSTSGAAGAVLAYYFPASKLNRNYIYVWNMSRKNYFGIQAITNVQNNCFNSTQYGLSVQQAFMLDSKIDDGFPMLGRVLAAENRGGPQWSHPPGGIGFVPPGDIGTNQSVSNSSSNCFWRTGSMQVFLYSTSYNNGTSINCNLSLRME